MYSHCSILHLFEGFNAVLVDNTKVRQVTEVFVVVHPIPYAKHFFNKEGRIVPKVVRCGILPRHLVESYGCLEGFWREILSNFAQYGPHCGSRVNHILNQEHVSAVETDFLKLFQAFDLASGCSVYIAGKLDKFGRQSGHALQGGEAFILIQLGLESFKELIAAVHEHDEEKFTLTSVVLDNALGQTGATSLDNSIWQQDALNVGFEALRHIKVIF